MCSPSRFLHRNSPSRYNLPKVLFFTILDTILAAVEFRLGLSRGWSPSRGHVSHRRLVA